MEVPVGSPAAGGPAPARQPASLPLPSRRVVVLLVGAAVLAALLWLGRDVLAPFVVGMLVVYLLDPVVERLARVALGGRHPPRALLILAVYVVATLALVEFLLVVSGPLVEQIRAFVRDAPGYLEDLNARLGELFTWWNRLDLPADVKVQVDAAIRDLLANLGSVIPAILRPVFSSVLGLIGSILGYLVVPVWAFWILKDRPRIVRAFDRAVPLAWRDDTWATVGIIRRVFGSWIRGQVVLGLTVGVATFAGLLVLGAVVDPVFARFAVLLAVIAGVLELLPIIGPIIAAVPAILLGATAGLPGIVAALLLYLVVQQLENNILVPKIQGDATNLHPAAVIFALVLGGAIGGLLGAILALPIAATLRDLYVYAFRRADGMTPREAATGDARSSPDTGPAGLASGPAGEAAEGRGSAPDGPAPAELSAPAHPTTTESGAAGDPAES
jgi:predicted PurR-regulated permease PerM